MRVITGKVVDGKVVVEGTELEDGAKVTILVRDPGDRFEVTRAQEAALIEAIAQADRGEVAQASMVRASG